MGGKSVSEDVKWQIIGQVQLGQLSNKKLQKNLLYQSTV